MPNVCTRIITGAFYCLAFFTPLLLTKYNSELFEFNKMLFVYGVTVIIAAAWLAKSITEKKFTLRHTPLDIPLLLFFLSQIISTVYSIDPHMSVWGYYGRFNGGLISIVCYLILYSAAVTHLSKKHVQTMVTATIASATLVALYAVGQRFGIDDHLWVQDVKNRVFSTLGQPNWLAAYMAIVIPLTLASGLASISDRHDRKSYVKTGVYACLSVLFYVVLLFTKSRSGFVGFWIVNVFFWLIAGYVANRKKNMALIVNVFFVLITVLIGSPFPQLNRFAPETIEQQPPTEQTPALLITDSGDIRKIVWKGSIDAIKSNPVIGYGPETFAWVYYRFRPAEHNTTSEWDFLYNKAHNEYLNYGVTSGLFGLGTYVLVIGVGIGWFVKQELFLFLKRFKIEHNKNQLEITLLPLALFSSWLSILITNFFGFSVVVTNLYFFLIPAYVYILLVDTRRTYTVGFPSTRYVQQALTAVSVMTAIYILSGTVTYWMADYHYNRGTIYKSSGNQQAAFDHLTDAIRLRPVEPTYHAELSESLATFSVAAFEQNDASSSAAFAQSAIDESDTALRSSPYSISLWKSRTRMFYTLSQTDETYLANALISIQTAANLAPTDAKIRYNTGLLQNATGDNDTAIATMLKTVELKPNYRDAAWALALFYEEKNDIPSRDMWLKYILEKINSADQEVKNKLEQI